MKKIYTLLFICCITLLFTGCVKVSYNIEIDKNDKVTISETQAINIKPLQSFGNVNDDVKEQFDEIAKDLIKKGYTVNKYNDNEYTGLTAKKTNIPFSDLKKELSESFDNNKNTYEVKKGFFQNSYKINIIANKEKVAESMSGEKYNHTSSSKPDSFKENEPTPISVSHNEDPSTGEEVEVKKYEDGSVTEKRTNKQTGDVVETTTYANGGYSKSSYNEKEMQGFGNSMGSLIENIPGATPIMDMTIKIPVKASSHNADKVINEKEYYWNLVKDSDTEINLEYKKFNIFEICLVVILVLGVVFILKSSSNKVRKY